MEDETSFEEFYASVESKATSDQKIARVRERTKIGRFAITCKQTGEIIPLVNFSNLREELAEILGPHLVDWEDEGKRELLFRNCKPWEREDLTKTIERAIKQKGYNDHYRQREKEAEKTQTYEAPAQENPFSKYDQHGHVDMPILYQKSGGGEGEEAVKRNLVIKASNKHNENNDETKIFSFNMEWVDMNNSVGKPTVEDSVWTEKKTPMQRLRDTKCLPPALAEKGVTENDYFHLCDILISAYDKLPFQNLRGGPAVNEYMYFCCPLGPVCFVLQMMNPLTYLLYKPYDDDMDGRVLPSANEILRKYNLKAKKNTFNKAVFIVENEEQTSVAVPQQTRLPQYDIVYPTV